MSHTNSTPNYNLPQFITTDKPFWLTDVNTAYSDIDLALKNNADSVTTAGNNAIQALSDASTASAQASAADSKAAGALASIADTYDATATYSLGDLVIYNSLLYKNTTAITTPEAWDGSHWTRTTLENVDDSMKTSIDTNTSAIATLQAHPSATSSLLTTNDTFQVPASVMNCNFILILARRYGNAASIMLPKVTIAGSGTYLILDLVIDNGYWTFSITPTGLITLTSEHGSAPDCYVEAYGIN